MGKTLKHAVSLFLSCMKPLLLFELIYKGIQIIIILPLLQWIFQTALSYSGILFVSLDNLLDIVKNPVMVIALLIMGLIITAFTVMEISCLVLCFNQAENHEELGVFTLIKEGFERALIILSPKNLPLLIFTMLLIPLTTFAFGSSAAAQLQIPKFISEALPPTLDFVYHLVLGCLSLLALCLFYVFHYFFLEGKSAYQAAKASFQLSRKRKIKGLLGYTFWLVLVILFFLIVMMLIFIGGVWILSSLDIQKNTGIILYTAFQTFMSVAGYVLNTFTLFASYAYLSAMYFRWKKQDQEAMPGYITSKKKHERGKNTLLLIPICLGLIAVMTITNILTIRLMKGIDINESMDALQLQIIAHRGNAVSAPENTIPAFQKAIEAKANYAELDVQLSKDNVVVVTHDSNFQRMAGYNGNVWDMTYEEIQQLDASGTFIEYGKVTIPSLDEVIKFTKGKIKLLIELKPTHGNEEALAKATLDVLHKNGTEAESIIHSLSYKSLEEVKKINPDIHTGYCVSFVKGEFYDLPAADFFSIEQTYMDAGTLFKAHAKKKKVYVWTVDDEESMDKFIKMEVDGIITNNPAEAHERIKDQEGFLSFLYNLINERWDDLEQFE